MRRFPYIFLLATALFSTLLYGDEEKDRYGLLNEKSAGQLLYTLSAQSEPLVVVFRGFDEKKRQWLCTPLGNNKKVLCNPETFYVLPMGENVSEWELTTYAVYMFSRMGKLYPSYNEPLYTALLKWKGGSRADDIRSFMNDEAGVIMKLKRLLTQANESRQTSVRKGRWEKIIELLSEDKSDGVLLTEKVDALLARGDYFAAICLYSRFRADVVEIFSEQSGGNAVMKIFEKWDKMLATAYKDARGNPTTREQEFPKICSDVPSGPWNQGAPVSFIELQERCRESYNAFLKMRSLSSLCDFPQWGNNMLTVLSMLADDSADEYFGKEYDAALKKYKEIIQ